jgi:hypothetical protein
MKPLGNLSKLMACGVAFVATCVIPTAQAVTGKAVVRSIRGTASYAEQGGEYKDLRVGKVLGPGSYVKTSPSSQVDLFLSDNGPTVRLLADTTLGLDQLEIDKTGTDLIIFTQLNLTAGTIQGSVKQMHPASRYEVKTPFGVAGIRGTEYEISVDGTVRVWEGSLLVAYTNPITKVVTTHTVNTGETFTPPTTPEAPNAVPQVSPTPATIPPPQLPEHVEPAPPPTTTTTPVVLVPEPFVSPIIGEID